MKKQLSVLAGTCALVGAVGSTLFAAKGNQGIAEFGAGEADRLEWRIVNDGVMGGLSKGNISFTDGGTMVFKGNLSLENNGGFSSVRSGDVALDLSGFDGVAMRVKGDGRTYQLRLGTDATFRSMEMAFKAEFETRADEWIEVKVPFEEFVGSFRGRLLPDVPFDTGNVQRVGILLGDKKPGPFALEIDWVRGFRSGDGADGLVETALSDGRFNTLAKALSEAGLVDALSGDDPLTVFAPTDEAFAKLPEGTVEELLREENRDKLKAVLTYHVTAGSVGLADALKAGAFKTLQGSRAEIAFSDGRVKVNDAVLLNADIRCKNGVIHVIDSVILPPEPEPMKVLATAEAAGGFGLLLSAIEAAGLSDVLNGDGPFTVLAPTDAAIANLPEETVRELMKGENRDKLKSVLTYHVVAGNVSAGDALNAAVAETVNGADVRFAIRDGKFQVNDSTVRKTDIKCANGVIHVIDAVLLPPAVSDGEAVGRRGEGGNESSDDNGKSASVEREKAGAMQRILSAIDKGVPLYNGGDAGACASVYKTCIAGLMSDASIDCDLRDGLSSVLKKGEETRDDVARAWLFRRTLDRAIVMLSHSGRR